MINVLKLNILPRASFYMIMTLSLCLITACLFIPNVYAKIIVIIALGVFIFVCERKMKLLIPGSPGFIFWFGNFVPYIIGGLGSMFVVNAWGESDIRSYENALFYLGIGFSFYVVGMLCAHAFIASEKESGISLLDININPLSVCMFSLIIMFPVVLMTLIVESSFESIYYNLIIGPLMTIDKLPVILLAIYLFQRKPKWWVIILLFVGSLATSLGGISIGYGRQKIPIAVVTLSIVYISMHWVYKKRMPYLGKWLLFLSPFILIILFIINTVYRDNINLDHIASMEEKGEALIYSGRELFYAGNMSIESAFPLFDRLVEKESIELMNMAESGSIEKAGWTTGDIKQILLSWVPKIFYPEKGVGYGRDIMEYYGLCAPWNNIPVTVLADTFRRSGVVGVIMIYFMMGVLSTTIALKLKGKYGAFGVVLAYFFALLHLDLNNWDALSVFTLYIYRFISGGLVIYAIMRISGMLHAGIFSSNLRPVL